MSPLVFIFDIKLSQESAVDGSYLNGKEQNNARAQCHARAERPSAIKALKIQLGRIISNPMLLWRCESREYTCHAGKRTTKLKLTEKADVKQRAPLACAFALCV